MKTYVDYSHYAEEFSIAATLKIEDDGRFFYDEYWTSYGATMGGRADGVWWQYNDTIFFRCDYADGVMYLQWGRGQTMEAINRTDTIDFGGDFTMSLIGDKPVQPAQPPKGEEAVKPADEEQGKKLLSPSVAKLHFKDGRILEKQLPSDPLFGLFNETYYRLVDENGDETNVFKPRQNSDDSGSRVVDYDEL